MLDKIIDKFLDFFLESDVINSLEKNKSMSVFIEKVKDRKFIKHIIKYLIVGIITTIISLGTLYILESNKLFEENVCNFISIVVGVLSAYVLNRTYVFESKEKDILKEFSKFVMARVASSLFDMITFFIFATCLSFDVMIVKIVISIVVVILNYFLSKLLVFKQKEI